MIDPPASRTYDALYPVAEQQAGYFTAAQAGAAGYSRRQLTYYVTTRRFDRVRRGVYRLSHHPASANEDLFLAWLQVGPQAVISHESALALYELSDALPAAIHLTVTPQTSRRHPGLRLHTNRLSVDEITRFGGLPVTTVPRTILDVAVSGLAEELVFQAVRQAIQRGLVLAGTLRAAAERRGGRARRLIRRALQEATTGGITAVGLFAGPWRTGCAARALRSGFLFSACARWSSLNALSRASRLPSRATGC